MEPPFRNGLFSLLCTLDECGKQRDGVVGAGRGDDFASQAL